MIGTAAITSLALPACLIRPTQLTTTSGAELCHDARQTVRAFRIEPSDQARIDIGEMAGGLQRANRAHCLVASRLGKKAQERVAEHARGADNQDCALVHVRVPFELSVANLTSRSTRSLARRSGLKCSE